MESPQPRRILIVANRTSATPRLLEEVRRRAAGGPCEFTLVIPRSFWDADTEQSAVTLELAIPLLEEAAGARVEGMVGAEDALEAVREALDAAAYDEVLVSTLPTHVSHWLHIDLPARVQRLGIPVTTITAKHAGRSLGQPR